MPCPRVVPRIVLKPKRVMGSWAGMNAAAAGPAGFGHKVPENELWVLKTLPPKDRVTTALHEFIEWVRMRCSGQEYYTAHQLAEDIEKGVTKERPR